MKILKIQTLRGPNYWSIRRHKLVLMRLDLEELADKTTSEIPGFYEGLTAALPSLYSITVLQAIREASCNVSKQAR